MPKSLTRRLPALCFAMTSVLSGTEVSANADAAPLLHTPPAPRIWHRQPPPDALRHVQLADRQHLAGIPSRRISRQEARTPCADVTTMLDLHGDTLTDALITLPDYTCAYPLFTLDAAQAAIVYSPGNLHAVARRFVREATVYQARDRALVNLTLYLRAGYYLAANRSAPEPGGTLRPLLRPAIARLLQGEQLFAANAEAPISAGEVMKLISNMQDEAYYLDDLKTLLQRYGRQGAQALRETTAEQGFTGLLTVFYQAHNRPDARRLLQSDPTYFQALHQFVADGKASLAGTESAFQLADAARESFRFLQYPTLRQEVRQAVKSTLDSSAMTGPDRDLWLAAAQAVRFYDAEQCAAYGTCNFETRLAEAILPRRHACGETLRIRAQDMSQTEMRDACARLQDEEANFHQRLQTRGLPVADDHNRTLEVAVFDDYDNYTRYAPAIYGIDTGNGGMYQEGDPADPASQARFIAFEASWLRPRFQIWNLNHEYIHYLDGRFNLYGDFAQSTAQPTVWWIEGLAEYLSRRNDTPQAPDAARGRKYRLSEIFANTYAMPDYVNRGYHWGYLATRFMFEQHPAEVNVLLAQFRAGDYHAYRERIRQIGTRFDQEFDLWAQTVRLTPG